MEGLPNTIEEIGQDLEDMFVDFIEKEEIEKARATVGELFALYEDEIHRLGGELAAVYLDIKRGRIYHRAGMIEEAYENMEAARLEAHQRGEMELYDMICIEMDLMGI